MMNYDVIVIGSGIAGYSAALRSLEMGLSTAIISQGQSALHFSSGSIDLLSHSPINHQPISDPWAEIDRLVHKRPDHPYAKLGKHRIHDAINWFQTLMSRAGVSLSAQPNQENHFRITPLGTLKTTWLSQTHVAKLSFDFTELESIERLIMVSIDGFRDFQPHIAKGNLRASPHFAHLPMQIKTISTAAFKGVHRNPNELRSVDLARIFNDPENFQILCKQLIDSATPKDLVMLPAIFGDGDGLTMIDRLATETGLRFHELPTMPPSLLGMRIEDALAKEFTANGGIIHRGDTVVEGHFHASSSTLHLDSIRTKKLGDIRLSADHFILASGSFFSKGLVAHQKHIEEPIFGLDTSTIPERDRWYQSSFFSESPHAFMSFGVQTNNELTPSIKGKKVANLQCVGSILSGYNPVTHGCGGGVAISTAYAAISHILSCRKYEMQMSEVRA
ncbi:glycerol-3-phosphate dehydrogenase subunit GlpB [Vibrio sp.]|nr:glycerol-3-phosphate dehydrogenase subunit GlpB [Vibrio sp.]